MSNTITRDFDLKTRKALAKKGIVVVGTTAVKVTYPNGSWSYERFYKVNDNGCGKVWSWDQVKLAS